MSTYKVVGPRESKRLEREKLKYDNLPDRIKLRCPKCYLYQTFEQVEEKISKCPKCRKDFMPRAKFNPTKFNTRNSEFEILKISNTASLKAEIEAAELRELERSKAQKSKTRPTSATFNSTWRNNPIGSSELLIKQLLKTKSKLSRSNNADSNVTSPDDSSDVTSFDLKYSGNVVTLSASPSPSASSPGKLSLLGSHSKKCPTDSSNESPKRKQEVEVEAGTYSHLELIKKYTGYLENLDYGSIVSALIKTATDEADAVSQARFDALVNAQSFHEEEDVIFKEMQFDALLNNMINHPDTTSVSADSEGTLKSCVRLDSWNIDESSKHLSFVIKKSQQPVDYSSLVGSISKFNVPSMQSISRFGVATRPTGRILHYPLALTSMRGSRKCCVTFTMQAKAFNIGEYSSNRNKHNTGDLNVCFSGSGKVMVDLQNPTGSGLYGNSKVDEGDSHGDYIFSFGVGLKPALVNDEYDHPLNATENEPESVAAVAKSTKSLLNRVILRKLYSKYGADSEAVAALSESHKQLMASIAAERAVPLPPHPNSEYNPSMFGDICTNGMGSCLDSWGLRCPVRNPIGGMGKGKREKVPRAALWYHGGEMVEGMARSQSTVIGNNAFVEHLPRNFVLEPGHLCDVTVDLDKKEAFLCISKWVSGLDKSSKQTKSSGVIGRRKLIYLKRIELNSSIPRRADLLGREAKPHSNYLLPEDILIGCHVPIGYEVVMVLPGEEEKFGRQRLPEVENPQVRDTMDKNASVCSDDAGAGSACKSKWMAAKKFADEYETEMHEHKEHICHAVTGDYFDAETIKSNMRNRLESGNTPCKDGVDKLLLEAQEQERQLRFKLAHAAEGTMDTGDDISKFNRNHGSESDWEQHLNPLLVIGGRVLSRVELVSATDDPIRSTIKQYDTIMHGAAAPTKPPPNPVEAISLLHKHHRHKHKHHKHHKHHHHLDSDSYGSEHSFEDDFPDTYGVEQALATNKSHVGDGGSSQTQEVVGGKSNNKVVQQLNDCHDVIVEEYKHVSDVYNSGKTATKENIALLSAPIHSVKQLGMLQMEDSDRHERSHLHNEKDDLPIAPVLWMHGCAGVVPAESMVTGVLLPATQSLVNKIQVPETIPDNITERYNNPVAIASRSSTLLYSCIIKRPAGNPDKMGEITRNMGANAMAMHTEILNMQCPNDGTKPVFTDLSMDTWLHDNDVAPKDRPAQMLGLDFKEHVKQASLSIEQNPHNQPPSLTADGDAVYHKYVVTSCMENTKAHSKYIEYKQLDPETAQKVKELDPNFAASSNLCNIPYENLKIFGSVFAPRIKVNSRMFLDDGFGHTYQACVKTLEPGTICEYLMKMLQPSVEYVWKKGVLVQNERNDGSTSGGYTVYPPLYAVTTSKECPVRDMIQYIVRGTVPGKFNVISARYDIVVKPVEVPKAPSPARRIPSSMEVVDEDDGGLRNQGGVKLGVGDSFDDDEIWMRAYKNAELEHNHIIHRHTPPRIIGSGSLFSSNTSNTSSGDSSPVSNASPATISRFSTCTDHSVSQKLTPVMPKPAIAHGIPGFRIIQSRMWCFDYDMSQPVGVHVEGYNAGSSSAKENYMCYIASGEDYKALMNVEFLCVATVDT